MIVDKIDLEITQNNFEETTKVSSLEMVMQVDNIQIMFYFGLVPFSSLIIGYNKNTKEKRLEFFNKNSRKDFENMNSKQNTYPAYSVVKKGIEIEMLNLILDGTSNITSETLKNKLKDAIDFFN